MKNIERVKEILLQQMEVLQKNQRDTEYIDAAIAIEISKCIARDARTYVEACRVQMMKQEPIENYIPASSTLESSAETAE